MSRTMLSEFCNEAFFLTLLEYIDSISQPNIYSFIQNEADSLGAFMEAEYKSLPIIYDYSKVEAAKLLVSRYSNSLERIALALTRSYNPLHNVDVEESERNSGSDSHEYGGSDESRILENYGHSTYEQDRNSSTTTGSTYDNTNEAQMKPISKTTRLFDTQTTTEMTAHTDTEYGKKLEMSYGREILKTRKGNIGVMPTQNLLQLEYYTRIRMTLFDAVIRATVNTLGSGVWSDD